MSRVAVYTSITGGYDLPRLNQPFGEADFFLFTDCIQTAGGWTICPSVDLFKDPRRNSRYHKLLSHHFFPEYDFSVWIDGRVEILSGIKRLVENLEDYDLLTFSHPDRKTVHEEAAECAGRILDD